MPRNLMQIRNFEYKEMPSKALAITTISRSDSCQLAIVICKDCKLTIVVSTVLLKFWELDNKSE